MMIQDIIRARVAGERVIIKGGLVDMFKKKKYVPLNHTDLRRIIAKAVPSSLACTSTSPPWRIFPAASTSNQQHTAEAMLGLKTSCVYERHRNSATPDFERLGNRLPLSATADQRTEERVVNVSP